MTTAMPAVRGSDGTKNSTYEQFLVESGERIVRGDAVPSLLDLALSPLPDGTSAAAVQLTGMQGLTSLRVIELPPGYQTPVRRHLYEEYMLALSGHGQVAYSGSSGGERTLPWRASSVLAVPLNMRHTVRNDSAQPARLVLVSNAHLWMDLLGRAAAAFECDLDFPEHEAVVLDAARETGLRKIGSRTAFAGSVFDDLATAALPEHAHLRGPGFGYLLLHLTGGVLGAHVGDLPSGHLTNAHWHMGGAILIAVAGEGYTLAWPPSAGRSPDAADVRRSEFTTTGAVCVGTGWYHMHANTGQRPLRQVAFRYGGGAGATFSTVQGVDYEPGRVIDIPDLPPEILNDFRTELARRGIPVAI